MARLSPAHLGRYVTKGRYQIPRHIQYLNEHLLAVAEGRLKGLIVCMPPRHGKSMLASNFFPAWYLSTHPDDRVLLASHEATLAAVWGRRARDTMALTGSLFGVSVRPDSRAAAHWSIDGREGGMDCAGVGGSFTGRGANIFVVDDPVKNSKEALSKAFRDQIWDLWSSTIETRAEPRCGFVVIQTRWHQDDLAGRLESQVLEEHRPGWKIIKLPAVAEDGDELGRQPGEALWPERYPAEHFTELKRKGNYDLSRLGSYWYEALYQQNPVPREGGKFARSWFRFFGINDNGDFVLETETGSKIVASASTWCLITVDLAVSLKNDADYFVAASWLVCDSGELLLTDIVRTRIPSPEQVRLLVNLQKEHEAQVVAVESVQYQLALVQQLAALGVPVFAVKVHGDKLARAQLAMARFSTGSIYIRQGAPWVPEYIDELAAFPMGRYDDQVDVTSMACDHIARMATVEY